MFRRIIAIAGSALMLSAPLAAQNQLTNAGFETGNFSGWTVGGNNSATAMVGVDGTPIPGVSGFFDPSFINVRSGTYAAGGVTRCAIAFCPASTLFFTLSQTLTLLPNTVYSTGFYAGVDAPDGVGADIGNNFLQIFFNGVGVLPDGHVDLDPGNTPADFSLVSGSFNSGATGTGTVTFQITASGTSEVGLSVDDFFVNGPSAVSTVPEPASLVLFGAGLMGVGFALRRRRTT